MAALRISGVTREWPEHPVVDEVRYLKDEVFDTPISERQTALQRWVEDSYRPQLLTPQGASR